MPSELGSAAIAMVEEDNVIVYFGLMMMLANAGIALSELANWLGTSTLDFVSVFLLVGSTFFVASMLLYQALQSTVSTEAAARTTPDDDD